MATHQKGIKIGAPPNAQAVFDLPIFLGDMILVAAGGLIGCERFTELFLKAKKEAFLVTLSGIEVTSGPGAEEVCGTGVD
jgi:hypothetical protein